MTTTKAGRGIKRRQRQFAGVLAVVPVKTMQRGQFTLVVRDDSGEILLTSADEVQFVSQSDGFNVSLRYDDPVYELDAYGRPEDVRVGANQRFVASIPAHMLLGIRWESIYGYGNETG